MLTISTRTLIACLFAFLVSTTLVGCGVLAALRSPSSSTPQRHFESDQRAEEAAMAVLPKYYAASDHVLNDGGMRPDRVYPYVTPAHRAELNNMFDQVRHAAWIMTGATRIIGNRLLSSSEAEGEATVVMRLCLDVANTSVVDEANGGLEVSGGLAHKVVDLRLITSDGEGSRLYVDTERTRTELQSC